VPNVQEIVEKINNQKDEEARLSALKLNQQSSAINNYHHMENFFNNKDAIHVKNNSFIFDFRFEQIEKIPKMTKN
jgi:hypothetical protein